MRIQILIGKMYMRIQILVSHYLLCIKEIQWWNIDFLLYAPTETKKKKKNFLKSNKYK